MDSLTAGTFVGAGSFRCRECGFVLTLTGLDSLTDCPHCGGEEFVRASLFNTERIGRQEQRTQAGGAPPANQPAERESQLARVRGQIEHPGEYLCYEEGGELCTLALTREWTRIGRSLAADVRFDDPTVSRRHALIVRHPDGVRVLDDRSLNGVFVNGTRVEGQLLSDGDEIVVGRYHLTFLSVPAPAEAPAQGAGAGSRSTGA
jgi:pSer/pThr/pTyr-binding forkhead associated (FHA) protein